MRLWPFARAPRLRLGTYAEGFPLFPGTLALKGAHVHSHKHLIGVSGSGKSRLMESLFWQLFSQGIGVSFLDPHSDSANAILARLIRQGYFANPAAYGRLLYIEFREEGPYLAFNVLADPRAQPHTVASRVLEAMHRCWPALGEGAAPQFDNLVLAGTMVLLANHLPLTALGSLLTNRAFRESLLPRVQEAAVVRFFRERFDRWSGPDAAQMIESTLRRLFLLTFAPVLQYSLGQTETALDFRPIIDRGTAVLYDLGHIQDHDARRLLGCLITLGYEAAALSRSDLEEGPARRPHHLLLDEFSDYSAQSEEALSRTLSLTRKFGLYATMAHQTWSQASERLQGALQNVGVRIAFRVGRPDAERLARQLGAVDPLRIKSEALLNDDDEPKNHPVFLELGAQWEEWVRTLTDQHDRLALAHVQGWPTAVQIKTLKVGRAKVDPERVAEVKEHYQQLLMRPRDAIIAEETKRYYSTQPPRGRALKLTP